MKLIRTLLLATALAASLTGAHAALFNRGGGMIYDDVQNITWLQDWNYNKTLFTASGGTQGFQGGFMTWTQANNWAENLVFGGYDDWRLPSTLQPDPTCAQSETPAGFGTQNFGQNCRGSELGHLFYIDLGGRAPETVLDPTGDTPLQIANVALFKNFFLDYYWSGTSYAPDTRQAWRFAYQGGSQVQGEKKLGFTAVAVRDGDVGAPGSVPEAPTLALVLVALGALAARSRASGRPARKRESPSL
jgi:hypothetical protein